MKEEKRNDEVRSSEDRALDRFAELMINKISTLKEDWHKPWFTEGTLSWPKNMSGREYNGMNALMLMMECEQKGYRIPVFMTFDRIQKMNAMVEHIENLVSRRYELYFSLYLKKCDSQVILHLRDGFSGCGDELHFHAGFILHTLYSEQIGVETECGESAYLI